MTNQNDPIAARRDRLQILSRIVDRLLDNDQHMDAVCRSAIDTSGGSAKKREREQAEDLHSAIVAARDPELARKWEHALSSWCESQSGVPDLKIVGWALEANEARGTAPVADLKALPGPETDQEEGAEKAG